ncbi:PADI2 deiminase, partial [Atractosteus spatula]|nr:PADI2 deiminase [Atractosteus spatula]
MVRQRTVRIESGVITRVVYVVGTEMIVNVHRSAPPESKSFGVQCSSAVQFQISPSTQDAFPLPLTGASFLHIRMDSASKHANADKLSVTYYGKDKEELGKAILHLTAIEISLDVDADRDGVVEENNAHKASWKWGPNGHGAVLLVNCDSEWVYKKRQDCEIDKITKSSDLADMSQMLLRTSGPVELPEGYKITLHISQSDSGKIGVFQKDKSLSVLNYPLVLGQKRLSHVVKYRGGASETEFFVEGRRFPDEDFPGLVTINLSLLEPSTPGFPETPIFTDTVVFRVAPWIMTPNTLRPLEVFVCSTRDNFQFLKGMKELVSRCGIKMKMCYEYMNRGDRWMQGPDFGYVTRVAWDEKVSSLDSFGNLEVSPPVTVNGKVYPLGRIIIGCAFPTASQGRNMTKVVQDFLWAQKVQSPVALFSDWLYVGHVDEFMTFVPAPDRKGFRLLLASPDAGYKLFRGLQKAGHGKAKMFEGMKEQISVETILSDKRLQEENNFVQSCIDWNRDVLKKELGLGDEDIIDLPILFKLEKNKRAIAYYPDMVNMIVLGKNVGIPKPYGPKVGGRCALEAEVCSLLKGLGLNCTFIDDFASYHKLLGEVHCGSNVRREPFPYKWWEMEL